MIEESPRRQHRKCVQRRCRNEQRSETVLFLNERADQGRNEKPGAIRRPQQSNHKRSCALFGVFHRISIVERRCHIEDNDARQCSDDCQPQVGGGAQQDQERNPNGAGYDHSTDLPQARCERRTGQRCQSGRYIEPGEERTERAVVETKPLTEIEVEIGNEQRRSP